MGITWRFYEDYDMGMILLDLRVVGGSPKSFGAPAFQTMRTATYPLDKQNRQPQKIG